MKDDFKGVEIDQFKDEDIIKALKYCIDENVPCDNCLCWKNCCTLEKDCLSLINRQKAEILELQKRIINWRTDMDYRPDEIKSETIKEFAKEFEYFVLNEDIEVVEPKCKDYESYINGANQFRHQIKNGINNIKERFYQEKECMT